MEDRHVFADEVFGFHAQQAIEKSLKAWIIVSGNDYPLTHNIIVLLSAIEDSGDDAARFWDLVKYNAFAVQFRYEQMGVLGEELDRLEVILQVTELMRHVGNLTA